MHCSYQVKITWAENSLMCCVDVRFTRLCYNNTQQCDTCARLTAFIIGENRRVRSSGTDMIQSSRSPTYKRTGHRIASNVSMDVTLLPRMTCSDDGYKQGIDVYATIWLLTTVPMGCFCAGFVSSKASSMTRFKKRSYPRNVPLTLRPPCKWTKSFLSMNYGQ